MSTEHEQCQKPTCKLDRLQLYGDRDPTKAFRNHPLFRGAKGCRLKQGETKRFQPYLRAHWFDCQNSDMRFCIESDPVVRWIAPVRLTLYGDDETGLLPEEVFGVLELLPDRFKLTLVELAFDWGTV